MRCAACDVCLSLVGGCLGESRVRTDYCSYLQYGERVSVCGLICARRGRGPRRCAVIPASATGTVVRAEPCRCREGTESDMSYDIDNDMSAADDMS